MFHPHFLFLLFFLSMSISLGLCAVDFKINFLNQPASIRFNPFYAKYEVLLELKITELRHLSRNFNRLITGLKVATEKAMQSEDFGATVLARMSSDGTGGQLVFLCSTSLRCANIKMKLDASPSFIQQAVEFAPFGLQGGLLVQFGSVRPSGRPAISDVVFQRHLDSSLSFVKSWDAYVNGFGDSRSNYWMGLEQLSALTKDRDCKWTIEVTLFSGAVLSATYKDFQVRGADENYRLRVGAKESGSLHIYELQHHNNRQFSTFDRDNDDWSSGHCSGSHAGSSGWWFGNCDYKFNPNGRIISESDAATECSWGNGCGKFYNGQTYKYACIKRSQLSFRCN